VTSSSSAAQAPAATSAPASATPPLHVVEVPSALRLRHHSGRAAVRACRPRHWVKNVLVVVAPASAGVLTRPSDVAAVLAALVAFCALSSATYLLNDVRDREQDRRHPRKRHRPVASGQLSPRRALQMAAGLVLLGLGVAATQRVALAVVGLAYLALTTGYSLWWRHIVVADVAVVAAGFVLRTVAGGVAVGVPLSTALLTVTSACALFLVVGKRLAELTARRPGPVTRATLHRYSPRLLRRLLLGSAAVAVVAYSEWALRRSGHGVWFELSVAPFLLWLGRYRRLVDVGLGEAPEDLILGDPGLIALAAVWLVLFTAGACLA
jgi:decaprenyl-phosphate phosphoribosyltransferase